MSSTEFVVITLLPEILAGFSSSGVVGQALSRGLLGYRTVNPREFAEDTYKTVDDRPFGGGDGMVLTASPVLQAVRSVERSPRRRVIHLTPQGSVLNHAHVVRLARDYDQLILLCGRYGGIDERAIQTCCDEEISIGDYVLSGGEVAAMALIDAVARHLPGVLGNAASANVDSLADGLLEGPVFTRPRDFEAQSVPAVLTSGDHALIAQFRRRVGVLRTHSRRPDLWALFRAQDASAADKELAQAQSWAAGLPEGERRLLGLSDKFKD
jgi:tRNA (guanine37-N1)-methyltransferase